MTLPVTAEERCSVRFDTGPCDSLRPKLPEQEQSGLLFSRKIRRFHQKVA
jgi:hypothetical protein